MTDIVAPPPRRFTLRLTLGTVIAGLLVLTVCGVGGVALAIRARTRDATARALLREVADGIEREMRGRLGIAEETLRQLAADGGAGRLPLEDTSALADRLSERMRCERRFEWLAFLTPRAAGAVALRRADGSVTLVRQGTDARLVQERVAPDGSRSPVVTGISKLEDLLEAPWFEQALDGDAPAWTALYVRPVDGSTGRACGLALRRGGEVVGVFGVGFSTAFAGAFLEEVWNGREGAVVVWNPTTRRAGATSSASEAEKVLPLVTEAAEELLSGLEGLAMDEVRTSTRDAETWVVGLRRLLVSPTMPALLAVAVPEESLVGYFRPSTVLGATLAGLLLSAGVLAALWVSHRVTLPLRRVAGDLGRVATFDLSDAEAPASRIVEVAVVSDAASRMKRSLRSFARYVPTDLVRELLGSGGEARLGGAERTLTLFFSDVEGFTAASEGRPPQAVVEALGDYLSIVVAEIAATGGTVDKFVGDGVVAFFNAPRADARHAESACRAALRLQAALTRARPGWIAAGRPAFRTRVGLHTGSVVVGNIGTPDRFAYTVIGDGANLAARLEALNKVYGTWILVSHQTREAAGDAFAWRHLDRVSVAGRSGVEDVYELLGFVEQVGPQTLQARDDYERALGDLWSRRFEEAAVGFERALALRPDDLAARTHAAQARSYAQAPPPPGWDGVHARGKP